MGDYPTVDRYFGQKEAFLSGKNYTETDWDGSDRVFELQEFNDRNFFVTFIYDPNGSGYEYTIFIGDKKIDIWIGVKNEEQKSESDELFGELIIEEL